MILVEEYRLRRRNLEQKDELSAKDLLVYEELLYRIHVIQVLKFLLEHAPVSREISTLAGHWEAVDALASHLCQERRLSPSPDAQIQQQRDTARQFLMEILTEQRRRFFVYMPENERQYQADIRDTLQCLLFAWLQYRETMMPISEEDEVTGK